MAHAPGWAQAEALIEALRSGSLEGQSAESYYFQVSQGFPSRLLFDLRWNLFAPLLDLR